MNKILKNILRILISPFIIPYEVVRGSFILIKKLFCHHEWETRDVKIKCDHHDGINNTVFKNQWIYCRKCNKGYEAVRRPKEWGNWERRYALREMFDLNPPGRPIEKWVNVHGQKNKSQSKQETRQNKIDTFLNSESPGDKKKSKLDSLLKSKSSK